MSLQPNPYAKARDNPVNAIYSVVAKAGGDYVAYPDVKSAAKAFQATDANSSPYVIRSIGGSASIIADTVKYGDASHSKSVGNSPLDGGAFKRAFDMLREVQPDKSRGMSR